ncbi:MAG: cyanophycinase [Planctomycetota bacterium]|nr:cyanophycinase [Planctomycetota bacterium]
MAASHPTSRWLLGAAGSSLVLLAISCSAPGAPRSVPGGAAAGPVIAVGGGGTPDEVPAVALELARARRGPEPAVVVVPHASSREDRGVASARMWDAAGAGSSELLADDAETARVQLMNADVIWMGGGSQFRLLDHLEARGLVQVLRAAHRRGAVIGGTSAGAAVLGSVTISGAPDPAPYLAGAVERREGLGLIADAIVDQHFAERRREGRLLTALFEGGARRGFGIPERTALVFSADDADVIGASPVVLVDASRAGPRALEGVPAAPFDGLRVTLVRPGQTCLLGSAGTPKARGSSGR